jgi:chemotaxis protein CheD
MTRALKSPSIPIGEIGVARGEGVLRTLLGSCVGLALYDRKRKIGGLAHIVLPQANGTADLPGKYADTAIPETIRRLQELAAGERLSLTAKLAGGANMFATAGAAATIGQRNIDAVERILGELGIPIVGRHVGGEQGRRMTLDIPTGSVAIDVVGSETVLL